MLAVLCCVLDMHKSSWSHSRWLVPSGHRPWLGEGPNKQNKDQHRSVITDKWAKCQRNTLLEVVAAEPLGVNILPAHKAEVNPFATLIKYSSLRHQTALRAGSCARSTGWCRQRGQIMLSAQAALHPCVEKVGVSQAEMCLHLTAALPSGCSQPC